MRALNFGRATLAGIAGTAVMTLMTFMAGAMGVKMDIPGMLSGFMGTPVAVGAPNAWVMVTGSLMGHLVYGAIVGAVYGPASGVPATGRSPRAAG